MKGGTSLSGWPLGEWLFFARFFALAGETTSHFSERKFNELLFDMVFFQISAISWFDSAEASSTN